MRVAPGVLLALLVVVPGASARPGLVGGNAVLRPDERVVVVEVRCQAGAAAAACTGTLRFTTFDGAVATFGRRVAIHPGARRRLALRLLPGGISIIAHDTNAEALAEVRLDRGRRHSRTDVSLSVRPTCASGATIATSTIVRVFRYVALSVTGGFKCSGTAVTVFDIPARRRVHARGVSTRNESYANSCTSTGASAPWAPPVGGRRLLGDRGRRRRGGDPRGRRHRRPGARARPGRLPIRRSQPV